MDRAAFVVGVVGASPGPRRAHSPARPRRPTTAFYITTAIPYVDAAPRPGSVRADALSPAARPDGLVPHRHRRQRLDVTAVRAAGAGVRRPQRQPVRRPARAAGAVLRRLPAHTRADPRHRPGVELLWRCCVAAGGSTTGALLRRLSAVLGARQPLAGCPRTRCAARHLGNGLANRGCTEPSPRPTGTRDGVVTGTRALPRHRRAAGSATTGRRRLQPGGLDRRPPRRRGRRDRPPTPASMPEGARAGGRWAARSPAPVGGAGLPRSVRPARPRASGASSGRTRPARSARSSSTRGCGRRSSPPGPRWRSRGRPGRPGRCGTACRRSS